MPLTIVTSDRFADHLTPPGHPERVERAEVMQVVASEFSAGGGAVIEPRAATDDELARVHERDYLTLLRETAECLAQLRGSTLAELAALTSANARALFRLPS